MKLYDLNPSFNSRKVRAVAAELGLDLEIHQVDFMKGEHKQPDFLAKNPNGKMPVLEDGDFVLWESNAILSYLTDINPEATISPNTSRLKAEINRWLFWDACNLNKAVSTLFFEIILKPMFGAGQADQNKVESTRKDLYNLAGILNNHLANREYVAGPLSVADFSLAADLAVREHIGLNDTDYPNLKSWLERVEARDSWKKSEPTWMPPKP